MVIQFGIQQITNTNYSQQNNMHIQTPHRKRIKRTNQNNNTQNKEKQQINKQILPVRDNTKTMLAPQKKSNQIISDATGIPLLKVSKSIGRFQKSPRQSNHQDKTVEQQSEKVDRKQSKDTEQYYIFWKDKANQYQDMNFNLQKANSVLEQQLQIIKYQNQKLERKLKRMALEPTPTFSDPLEKEKLQKYYEFKINSLIKKVEQQEIIIHKQDQKLKQLSKQTSENHKLQSFLQNMEDRVSQIDDNKSNASSRINSVKKIVMPSRLTRLKKHNSSHKNLQNSTTLRYIVPHDDDSAEQFDYRNSLTPLVNRSRYNFHSNSQFNIQGIQGDDMNSIDGTLDHI